MGLFCHVVPGPQELNLKLKVHSWRCLDLNLTLGMVKIRHIRLVKSKATASFANGETTETTTEFFCS